MSMTTKRLQSIAKHTNALLKQSKAIDVLVRMNQKLSARPYCDDTDAESDLMCAVSYAEDTVEQVRELIKEAEAKLYKAARAHGRVVRERAKARS